MSSFLCSDAHFAVVAKCMFLQQDKQQRFANTLKRLNLNSVNHRYEEKTRFRAVNLSAFDDDLLHQYNHHDVLRLLQCIDYQSSDAPDYDDTLFLITERLLIRQGAVAGQSRPNLWSI